MICDFKLAANVVRGRIRRDCVWMATSRSGFETVSIHVVRKREAGFSNVKSFAFITLELVDNVHRLTVCMSSYGVSEVGT